MPSILHESRAAYAVVQDAVRHKTEVLGSLIGARHHDYRPAGIGKRVWTAEATVHR